MPNQISGPNTSAKLINNSFLNQVYVFSFLEQKFHAGGKINFKLIRSLYKQIKHFNPDLVHISGLQSSGFHAMIATKLAKKKALLAVRGFSGDAIGLGKFQRFIFNRIIEPITLRLADYVYTVCHDALNNPVIKKAKPRVNCVIYNPAPNIPIAFSNNTRRNLGISKDDTIIASVGRIIKDKGYHHLVEVIHKFSNVKDIKFIIIGEGNYLDQMKKALSDQNDQVFFLGHRNDVLDILNECNLFIFPTLHENLSNALLEACITKNAIIATKVGGNIDVITHGYNGLLVNPGDINAMFESINICYHNKEYMIQLAENAYETAITKFSQNVILRQIDSLYKKLINNNKN